ncbi:MAG: glycosyl hydrolase family 28-related protein, partial [Terracidiphilus sp.]
VSGTVPDGIGSLQMNLSNALLVTARPYNAKCDGSTDDQAAIQEAFNDAQSNGGAVQFPAGTCLTSTIKYYGQPFFGAGKNVTFIKGRPGQDVFQTPDTTVTLDYGAHIHDLTIEVDGTMNAAATEAGGNNTFPNRVFGTLGGTAPIPSVYGGPPAPAALTFDGTVTGNCGGSISAGSKVLTLPCGALTQIPPSYFVGGSITVNGAGLGSANLTTTVAGVLNATTLTLATNASTPVSGAHTTISAAKSIAPPWYCGNAAIAIPASNGAAMARGLNGWVFDNIQIELLNGGTGANNTCGIFIQAAPNALVFQHVDVMQFYGGIIEAPPALNNASYFAWTNDTSQYINTNLKFNIIPMTWINGSHRSASSISIYGGNVPFSMGLFQFQIPLGESNGVIASATFDRLYYECWTPNSGEQSRFSGTDIISGGNMTQCNGAGYVNWLASNSLINAQIGTGIRIGGNHNIFLNASIAGGVVDGGLGNSVQTAVNTSDAFEQRSYDADPIPHQDPLGKLDGSFLIGGNGGTPFLNGSDLVTTCVDYRLALSKEFGSSCENDPTGSEITRRYLKLTGGVNWRTGTPTYTSRFKFGTRLPLSKMNVITQGECVGSSACALTIFFGDSAGSNDAHGSCTLSYGSSWTINGTPGSATACAVDFSSAVIGNNLTLTINPSMGSPSNVRIAFIGFQPQVIATQVNGGSVPASATILGTNALGQLVDASKALPNINTTLHTSLPLASNMPTVIYKSGDVKATSSASGVSTWTAPTAGNYRITLFGNVTSAGTGGTFQADLQCRGGGSWTSGVAGSLANAGQGSSVSIVCRLPAGNGFQYNMSFSAATGIPIVIYDLYVEQLP